MQRKYATSTLLIKIKMDQRPLNLYIRRLENFYTEPRMPSHGKYFYYSRGKMGRHQLQNRLTFMTELGPWLEDPNNGNDQNLLLMIFLAVVSNESMS